jgi:hypothetical protein
MSDLLDIYSDLSSFSLANEIINEVGNNDVVCNTGVTGNICTVSCNYYVYFGASIFIGFVIYLIYKFYFSKKQINYAVNYEANNAVNNQRQYDIKEQQQQVVENMQQTVPQHVPQNILENDIESAPEANSFDSNIFSSF